MQQKTETTPLYARGSAIYNADRTTISFLALAGIVCSMFIVFICAFCITYIYSNSNTSSSVLMGLAASSVFFCLLWCFSLCSTKFVSTMRGMCLEREDYDKILAFEEPDYDSQIENDNETKYIANPTSSSIAISYEDLAPRRERLY